MTWRNEKRRQGPWPAWRRPVPRSARRPVRDGRRDGATNVGTLNPLASVVSRSGRHERSPDMDILEQAIADRERLIPPRERPDSPWGFPRALIRDCVGRGRETGATSAELWRSGTI